MPFKAVVILWERAGTLRGRCRLIKLRAGYGSA